MLLSTLQTVGLLVGIGYYIMTLRTQLKTQEHTKETREIQLLFNTNQNIIETGPTAWNEIMDINWDSYEDFVTKYGWQNNPELHTKRVIIFRSLNTSGLLVKKGLIKCQSFIQFVGDNPPIVWEKYKDIIQEQRRIFDNPEHYQGIEHLATQIEKYRKDKGWKPKTETTLQ